MSYVSQTVIWVVAMALAGNLLGLVIRALLLRRGKESHE